MQGDGLLREDPHHPVAGHVEMLRLGVNVTHLALLTLQFSLKLKRKLNLEMQSSTQAELV